MNFNSCNVLKYKVKQVLRTAQNYEDFNVKIELHNFPVADCDLAEKLLYYFTNRFDDENTFEFARNFISKKDIGILGFDKHKCICERLPFLSLLKHLDKNTLLTDLFRRYQNVAIMGNCKIHSLE